VGQSRHGPSLVFDRLISLPPFFLVRRIFCLSFLDHSLSSDKSIGLLQPPNVTYSSTAFLFPVVGVSELYFIVHFSSASLIIPLHDSLRQFFLSHKSRRYLKPFSLRSYTHLGLLLFPPSCGPFRSTPFAILEISF